MLHFPVELNKTSFALAQHLTPNAEIAIHRFPAGNHDLRLGVSDSHPNTFTLSCKPPQCLQEVKG